MTHARAGRRAQPGTRRARWAAVVAAAVTAATWALPAPAARAASTADAWPAAAPAPSTGARNLASLVAPATQAPASDAGPYEPGFQDLPLATNPISPSVADVPAQSDELDDRLDDLAAAEGRLADAVAHRDGLRRRLVELEDERIATYELLGERVLAEEQRGRERAEAVALHQRRVEQVGEAATALEAAQDDLRDLLIAAYVSESSADTDLVAILSGGGDADAAVLRLSLGEGAVAGRAQDVADRLDDLAAAQEARDEALAARERAEQAERDAIAARQDAEQRIEDIATETVETQQAEVASVDAVAAREREVLLAHADVVPARLRADVVGGGIDFPVVALDAWVKAAAGAPCRVEWWMLAGISKIEGRHGTHGGGRLGARGYPSTEIIGPQLNGHVFARITDTDGGRWDHDTAFDRAVGPMQFIPSTWARWGRDGDGDGVADPHTIYDAAAAAAAYLCHGRTDLTDEGQLRAAYFSYNHSGLYVEAVLSAARGYRAALDVPPHDPTGPPAPGP